VFLEFFQYKYIEFRNAYGKFGDVKLVYVESFVWGGRQGVSHSFKAKDSIFNLTVRTLKFEHMVKTVGKLAVI
jgi:hypothetical protein